ncbi:hypothetical protein LguiA_005456 [Lonicera macranthoides]
MAVMYLRQVASGVLRRRLQLGYHSLHQTIIASSTNSLTGGTTTTNNNNTLPIAGERIFNYQYGSGGHTWSEWHGDVFPWIFLCGHAVLFLGINASPVLAEDVSIELNSESDTTGPNLTGLRKIEDGSVVSNLHTSKWRVFTDNGRELFSQGKLEDAERLFQAALKEAKEGFGARDPHVASACNNLAELYRIRKTFDKAEPLYLEAINILEESYGPDDIRVGAALHNLGKFYLVQRKLEEARVCYEIKRRVLGENHIDYADTMYHLGTLLHLQGKERDSEALIQDSIRILEEGGQGESTTYIRRLRYLAQLYIKSNRVTDAENIQRKILHMMQLSKGWNSLETIIAAEGLALTLQSVGSLKEAKELLERCLDVRKNILSPDHIQIAVNMLHLARVEMLTSNRLKKTSTSEATAELDSAKDLLDNAIRIAWQVLDKNKKGNHKSYGTSRDARRDGHTALIILLQSLNALGLLEINKAELQESREQETLVGAENALYQGISAFKEYGSLFNSPEVEVEYLSCLRQLSALLTDNSNSGSNQFGRPTLQEAKDEIKHIERQISSNRVRRS